VQLTYVVLTKISPSNDNRNITMSVSISLGCVPLTIAAATIVARYFISDPGCDTNIAICFPSPESCGSCQYRYRHQDAETVESSISFFSNAERLYLQFYT
jgi:hypothetical protein